MKILILTGKFGMGHCCAADAIKRELKKVNPDAQVNSIDMLEEMFPSLKNVIYSLFNFMVNKCSNLYNFLNRLAGKSSGLPMKRVIAKLTSRIVDEYQPDIIVSTLPLCSQCVSAYKSVNESEILLYTYITDVIPHEEWIEEGTNCYFVASPQTKEQLISRGVSASCVHICGIPVRPEFSRTKKAADGKRPPEILIMGGGLGLIPGLDEFLGKLSASKNLHVTLIAGRNQALYEQVKKSFPNVTVVGFTSEVAKYMKNADLLVTKSGGITTFEAMHANVPMYIIKPFLMQEVGNAEFIAAHNMGAVAWNDKTDIGAQIIALAGDANRLSAMRASMNAYIASLEPLCPNELYCLRRVA